MIPVARKVWQPIGIVTLAKNSGFWRGPVPRWSSPSARLFLCTSKPAVYAARILDRFGLDRYFDAVYGAELDGRREDKGEFIAHILSERGHDPGDCVMWGDRKHDVLGASRHGIPTIGALWGYGGEEELRAAKAAALCASPAEVPAAFRRFPRAEVRGKTPPHDR